MHIKKRNNYKNLNTKICKIMNTNYRERNNYRYK